MDFDDIVVLPSRRLCPPPPSPLSLPPSFTTDAEPLGCIDICLYVCDKQAEPNQQGRRPSKMQAPPSSQTGTDPRKWKHVDRC